MTSTPLLQFLSLGLLYEQRKVIKYFMASIPHFHSPTVTVSAAQPPPLPHFLFCLIFWVFLLIIFKFSLVGFTYPFLQDSPGVGCPVWDLTFALLLKFQKLRLSFCAFQDSLKHPLCMLGPLVANCLYYELLYEGQENEQLPRQWMTLEEDVMPGLWCI